MYLLPYFNRKKLVRVKEWSVFKRNAPISNSHFFGGLKKSAGKGLWIFFCLFVTSNTCYKKNTEMRTNPNFFKTKVTCWVDPKKKSHCGGFQGGKFVRSGYILDSSLFEYKNCIKDRTIYLGRNKYFWVKYQTSFYEIYIINGSDNKHIG